MVRSPAKVVGSGGPPVQTAETNLRAEQMVGAGIPETIKAQVKIKPD